MMKASKKATLLLSFLLVVFTSVAQFKNYQYQREIQGDAKLWHSIALPDDIYQHLNDQLTDIRIYSIQNQDTLEEPYLIRFNKSKKELTNVDFEVINRSMSEGKSYVTFSASSKQTINQIELLFQESNFDWITKLEGSMNQEQWFTVLDNYRIISIDNTNTQFTFSTLHFKPSNYLYYRLSIESETTVDLIHAKTQMVTIDQGKRKFYSIVKKSTKTPDNQHLTQIDIELENYVPVDQISVQVSDTFDFYRPITVKYLIDSIETEKKTIYNYKTVDYAILNSVESRAFNFETTMAKHFRIEINNFNNAPLNISNIRFSGPSIELIGRFNNDGQHIVVYGNDRARKPQYDISHFENKIPTDLQPLVLGDEQFIEKQNLAKAKSPLFENTLWLWVVIVSIVLLLGWFSLKMLKN